ncbi:ribosome silencing factor [Roseospirillum parvum]|uniref:Ribosomal silencing factor RsfS n=1 Tax=Roseospirillum parvum TaxID=83401 RepID=A0A1G7U7B5_9PROT|nr:ribosome silencing factor [Roseospirillum parvum]SDG42650.1 ribosome-associated protein [Roseospirillum parvum]
MAANRELADAGFELGTQGPAGGAEAASTGLLAAVHAALDDGKAENIATVELTGKSTIADHMVVATGGSARHVGALAERVVELVKARGGRVTVEGLASCDWVLVDAGDVIVHVFRPEVRAFYNIEAMWTAPTVANDAGQPR